MPSRSHGISAPRPTSHAGFWLGVAATGFAWACLGLTGCGVGFGPMGAGTPVVPTHVITGTVLGGQQPVVGVQMALYAAGRTGTGSLARSMLTSPVTTNGNGAFTITGLYACNPGDQVYLVGTGGDAGGGVNPAIAMMAALGPCSTLQANAATTFITINEVTTVASVYALASFMTGTQNVGSDAAGSNALSAAFANTQTMVDTRSGQVPVISTGNGMVPQTTIHSLGNSVATCINSQAGSSACADLFSATTVAGNTPSDTLQAVLNIAHNPSVNSARIFQLATASPPFQPTLTAAPASYALTVTHPSDVLMYHNDMARDGVQSSELALKPGNVNSAQFGKLYSFAVDSTLFAQPLYVGGVGMPDGIVHNIVFAASTRGTVYAFDADNNNPAAGSLWTRTYLPTGERYFVTPTDLGGGCTNPPEAGIVGTPVIDRDRQTMYFVVKSITSSGSTTTHRLHAVSLLDGSERAGSPTVISPVFAGTGDGSSAGSIAFDGPHQNQRSALLLAPNASGGKTVWIAYASHCDATPYHGLVLGFDGANVASQTAAFNATPNGNDGGIWQSNGGLAADAQSSIYALSGNGTFDVDTGGVDYGDSALRLTAPAAGAASNLMKVADYFTPSNQAYLQSTDSDLGGTEPLLFHDPASGVAPQLMVASDKLGGIYLLNTSNLGRYNTGTNSGMNGDVQEFGAGHEMVYNFAFFGNTLYTSNPLRAYTFLSGTSTTAGRFNTTPAAERNLTGTAPVVSANGAADAVIWTEEQNGVLHAYTTPGLTEIYNTGQAANGRDTAPGFVKFTSPVIANGKVFLSGNGALAVYGPLP